MKTKKYLTYGLKHGKDRIVQRHRSQLRTFILLMTNTGLRPGEALSLKWKAIKKIVEIDNKMSIGVLTVQCTHSKVKKTREVIIYPTGVRALQIIRKQRENNK